MVKPAGTDSETKSILVVEDSKVQSLALKHLLEENGYTVTVADNAVHALGILPGSTFVLIISDINMPGMDGYEFCAKLKSDEGYRDIPVILLTSLSDPTDIIRGLQSGADNFITKPYEDEYLLSRIEHLLLNRQLRKFGKGGIALEIVFRGKKYSINSDRQQILDLLLSVFETAVDRNEKLLKTQATQYEMIELMAEKNIALLQAQEELERLMQNLEMEKQKLAEEKERVNAIIRSTVEGIIVTDVNQNVIMMNRAAEDFLEIEFNEIKNQSIDNVIKEYSLREKLNFILNKLKNEYDFDYKMNEGDKNFEKIIHGKTSLIVDRNENRLGTVTVISDVTKERRVDIMKTEFLSTAAHELRTPLTSIRGFSEILLTKPSLSGEEKTKYLNYINKQAIKLSLIVNDLLDVARIESGQGFVMNKTVCDMKKTIAEIIPEFSAISTKHNIRLDFTEANVICYADSDKIGQVIKNLISNSIKYSPNGGEVAVTLENRGDFCQVAVIDHGIGMTPEQVEKVFTKFYRVDSSNSAPEGTGLGMTIVKYLVESHGGRVCVESRPNEGTRVGFTIPLYNLNREHLPTD